MLADGTEYTGTFTHDVFEDGVNYFDTIG